MKKLIIIFGFLLMVLAIPDFSEATPVYIENPGFEADSQADGTWQWFITGWSIAGSAGVCDPTNSYFSTGVPEGDNVSFINNGSARGRSEGEA